jgi:hypothetical protein
MGTNHSTTTMSNVDCLRDELKRVTEENDSLTRENAALKKKLQHTDDPHLAELTLQVVNAGQRSTSDNVKAVFQQYADGEGKSYGLRLPAFKQALCAIRPEFRFMSAEEVEQLFVDTDVENDTALGLTEYSHALCKSLPLEQALCGLPLYRVIESALPGFHSMDPTDHLDAFSKLSDAEVARMVAAISPELERLLCDMIHELQHAYKLQAQRSGDSGGSNAGAKFSVTTLSGGCVSDFHAGLSKRVGGGS